MTFVVAGSAKAPAQSCHSRPSAGVSASKNGFVPNKIHWHLYRRMTEPATLLQLIRQVRAKRHATDALDDERLRLEGSLIEFIEDMCPSFRSARASTEVCFRTV